MNKKEFEKTFYKERRQAFIDSMEQQYSQWEILRVDRLEQEKQFEKFTGHIDIIEMHIPYTKYGYLFDLMGRTLLMDTYNPIKKKKMLICAGDSMNLDMFSAFYQRSTDRSKPSVEWRDLIKVLRRAEQIYDYIVFMVNNHDNRVWKMLMRNIIAKEVFDEIMHWMTSYHDAFNHEKFTKIITVPCSRFSEQGVIFQIGDLIISHFENNSIVPGVVPRDVIKYLVPRIEKDWNIVIQAHTHAQSKIANDRKICIECGALCGTLDYWRKGSMKGKGKLTSLGYAVCDMENGVADPNKTDFVFCEWEGYL